MKFIYTDKLLATNAFENDSELFIKSFKEMATWHYKNNNAIKAIFDLEGFAINEIDSEESLKRVPFIMVNLFKEREWLSVKREEIELTLGSSGTTGQRSLMHLDSGSLSRVKKLAYNCYRDLGITDHEKYNYLCFTYDPKVAGDVGTAFTDELLTSFTGQEEVYYAIKWNEELKDFKLDEEECVQKLLSFKDSNVPLRILGFPAFLYKLIMDHDINIELPKGSWLQTGGGWKNHTDEMIDKGTFRKFIKGRLGILEENQRDLFGMVEHGIPYVDDCNGRLKIPNYGRVFIRDPYTLEVVPEGQIGLIQFMCSYNSSYPSFNILSSDWGVKTSDESGSYLEIRGRAGINKQKGCAIKANELLRN